MLVEKLKRILRAHPAIYDRLRPAAALVRRARRVVFDRELARFRRYCAKLQDVIPEPVFVKVGAHDGITGDPCSDLLLAGARWKGLLIEPVPYCVERLKVNFADRRRFAIEQVAIGPRAGRSAFYYVDERAGDSLPGLPRWFNQLGSFDRNHIVKHLNGRLEPFVIESTVEVRPLSEVLDRHRIGEVHLLHIDAEGHDYEVLKTLDFTRHTPLAIFIEHHHLPRAQKTEMVDLLRRQGYTVRDCGRDYFAAMEAAGG